MLIAVMTTLVDGGGGGAPVGVTDAQVVPMRTSSSLALIAPVPDGELMAKYCSVPVPAPEPVVLPVGVGGEAAP